VSHTFSGQSAALCEQNAEWIVEDFEEISGGTASQVPLVNFGKVTFTGESSFVKSWDHIFIMIAGASATTSGGTAGANGGDIVDMVSSNGQTVIASASASSSTVAVQYVG
jgi:hypothetical protein